MQKLSLWSLRSYTSVWFCSDRIIIGFTWNLVEARNSATLSVLSEMIWTGQGEPTPWRFISKSSNIVQVIGDALPPIQNIRGCMDSWFISVEWCKENLLNYCRLSALSTLLPIWKFAGIVQTLQIRFGAIYRRSGTECPVNQWSSEENVPSI